MAECLALSKMDPTMLGKDPSYGCYWEWVLQDLGPQNAYMHRPLNWAYLEFVNQQEGASEVNTTCGNIEFPVRHLARVIHHAQADYMKRTHTFASSATELIATCRPPACTSADVEDLRYALSIPLIFDVNIAVETNNTVFNETCTGEQCYLASIVMAPPNMKGFQVTGQINENQRLRVVKGGGGEASREGGVGVSGIGPCLF